VGPASTTRTASHISISAVVTACSRSVTSTPKLLLRCASSSSTCRFPQKCSSTRRQRSSRVSSRASHPATCRSASSRTAARKQSKQRSKPRDFPPNAPKSSRLTTHIMAKRWARSPPPAAISSKTRSSRSCRSSATCHSVNSTSLMWRFVALQRSSSNPCNAKAASSCRPMAICAACASCATSTARYSSRTRCRRV